EPQYRVPEIVHDFYDVLLLKGDVLSLEFYERSKKDDEMFIDLQDGAYPTRSKAFYPAALERAQFSKFDFVVLRLENMGTLRREILDKNEQVFPTWEKEVSETKIKIEQSGTETLNYIDLF